jgi:hypothetical protein
LDTSAMPESLGPDEGIIDVDLNRNDGRDDHLLFAPPTPMPTASSRRAPVVNSPVRPGQTDPEDLFAQEVSAHFASTKALTPPSGMLSPPVRARGRPASASARPNASRLSTRGPSAGRIRPHSAKPSSSLPRWAERPAPEQHFHLTGATWQRREQEAPPSQADMDSGDFWPREAFGMRNSAGWAVRLTENKHKHGTSPSDSLFVDFIRAQSKYRNEYSGWTGVLEGRGQ